MEVRNIVIETLKKHDLQGYKSCHIQNCIIDTIDLIGSFELTTKLIIEGSIITNFHIHSCWFSSGFELKNCIVNNYIDYQMGGHNDKPIFLENNIFKGFVNFFDCQFNEPIYLNNNIFIEGSNLLGNLDEGYKNTFNNGYVASHNIGNIMSNRDA